MRVLDGRWEIARDPSNIGLAERWFERRHAEARLTPVPGIIQQVFPDYHGVAWYWHTFQPRTESQGLRAESNHDQTQSSVLSPQSWLLRFGAVDYLADVWLNGVRVGGHEGGETPFTLDVTNALRPDGENLLAVRVLNPSEARIDGFLLQETPHRNKFVKDYQPGRSYNAGGIVLPVTLQAASAMRIDDLFAHPDVASGLIQLHVTVRNDTGGAARGRLDAWVGPANSADAQSRATIDAVFDSGETSYALQLSILQPRLWDLNDPYLYRVTAKLMASGADGAAFAHTSAVRCGFRDFRVVDGYFRLNGRRIFLRSTHTGNHYPIGQLVPHDPDFYRRDLIYAKAAGFNMVRFISGMAWPEQLDFCDEIGLMVYEESLAGWLLADSPKMAERFDRSTREMVLRDRNHPSLTIWGMLNETRDGPVFRQAVQALSLVRSLDDTRLVLLSSGRWDGQPGIGSVSNPGSAEWEHVWGSEAPGAAPVPAQWQPMTAAYVEGAGDAHVYPPVPHPPEVLAFLRTLGQNSKPVFLSEYGIGSLFDAIRESRGFEQQGAPPELADAALIRSMADRLLADWERWGMTEVYPFAEDMLRDSQRLHARQRLLGFDLIRSNPNICGYNLTGMLDHALTGEGLWTFWREWKPGIVDALADGWAPLRWCLFAAPSHAYAGQMLKIEAVLANESALAPGDYPVRLRIAHARGIAWERQVTLHIPQPKAGQDGPLAIPVLSEEISLAGPAGAYTLAASLERGGSPAGGRLTFHISDKAALPRLDQEVTVWAVEERAAKWLEQHGVHCRRFEPSASSDSQIVLVGDRVAELEDESGWRALTAHIEQGSTAIFLSPQAFQRGDDPVGWLPLSDKGRCYAFHDWLYHKECVAKAHPIFADLQPQGVMDWEYYGPVIPQHLFEGQATPDDVAAAAFAVGYSKLGGYASGVLVGAYRLGVGRFVLNTLRVLENLAQHPAADRLLLNMIDYAARPL
jgi:hypothetical protein